MMLILMGLFSQAFFKPLNILRRLNTSLLPSFLITMGRASPALSLVVNRFLQPRHSLLRRIISLSLLRRESTTLLSEWLQKGHFMVTSMLHRGGSSYLPLLDECVLLTFWPFPFVF